MDVQEKANYLLEQVRLVLAKKDFVRTEIIAKKLAVKQFAEPGAKEDPKWQAIKIKYYSLMIEYHKHYAHYYEIAKAYREVRVLLLCTPLHSAAIACDGDSITTKGQSTCVVALAFF